MQFKKKLLVFPTHRAIRDYLSKEKLENKLLPFSMTIDDFLKKSITLNGKIYCEEEQRLLFLNEAIKNIDVSKLGISKEFTKFLKQNDYIYRFFLELSSEKIDINDIQSIDTYDFYDEHLNILKSIKNNYEQILEKKGFIDKVNLDKNYKINKEFLSKFSDIEIFFEGYFTKIEFDIISKCAQNSNLEINFHSNEYNKKSISKFNDFFEDKFKTDYDYKVNLSTKKIIKEIKSEKKTKNIQLKAFSSRLNQIAFIKSSVSDAVNKGIDPSKIVVVLPAESFASSMQLFDNEKYFNYAMGKSIKNFKLYQVAYAIYSYISEDEIKYIENLNHLGIDKAIIDETIKLVWNKRCNKDIFKIITDFIKSFENNQEILEKYDELLYKLNILIFSNENIILVKEVYKVFLQKISSITLDDINSGKITVLGLLETRNVNYDCVIICDFNESFIPKKSVKDKFLSTKIKEKVGLPTSIDREFLQKYYYKRLCDNTKYLYISYVSNDNSQISRFSNELFKDKINYKVEDSIYKHILYNTQKINYYDEDIIDKIDLGKFVWSASSLKVFLQCKRKFYLQYILKIKEHNTSLKPKPYELGNIIHLILEEYYKQDERDFSVIESLFNKHKSNNSFLILDLEIWKKKLYEFYLMDQERLKNRKIISLERPFSITFDGITLKGVIDRLDSYDDNYEVIDYKTSSSLRVDTIRTYEKSVDFQLEFYYLAISDLYKSDNIDCFYYDLSSNSFKKEEVLDKKLELLSQKFDDIKELSKNEISFDKCEDKTVCSYCPYVIICNRE